MSKFFRGKTDKTWWSLALKLWCEDIVSLKLGLKTLKDWYH